MKTTKLLISILLIVTLLAGCASATPTQPSTTQNLDQAPNITTTQAPTTQAPTTQPPTTVPPTTVPPTTAPNYPLAADFTVYDANGNEVKLSDFIGKKVIVNFWASWCNPCLSEMPHFQKMYKKYGDEIQFLMVNMTSFDTREQADNVLKTWKYTFPVFYDIDGNAADVYEVSAVPATYFINEEGCIIKSYVGSLTSHRLQTYIDILLATGE